ncbi:MAG: NAD(+) synthase, partial [Clostridia bacterium]|nr:NAD(+) synthase [Clostridia bacterium]
MKFGYVKVCAATPEIRVADVKFNTENIIKAIKESAANGSQLTVFPELCVCGYTCGDLFNQPALISACEKAVGQICKETEGLKTLVFIGVPLTYDGRLYNCAVALCNGEILGIVPKTFLPNYGEFYEARNFSPAPESESIVFADFCGQKNVRFGANLVFSAYNSVGFTVAAEICEDLWAPDSPSIGLAKGGANIIVNLSCSNETVGKAEYRRNLVKMQSAKLIAAYVYANAGSGESTTDLVFAGHNIIAENGVVLSESKLFENGLVYGEIDLGFLETERRRMSSVFRRNTVDKEYWNCFETFESGAEITRTYPKTPFVPESGLTERSELILNIQSKGLEKRLSHTGSNTAVIGVSGGLDSALALLVTVRAFKSLGKDLHDIIAVTMPGFGTTKKTKSNSVKLMEALGVAVKEIPVGKTVNSHF